LFKICTPFLNAQMENVVGKNSLNNTISNFYKIFKIIYWLDSETFDANLCPASGHGMLTCCLSGAENGEWEWVAVRQKSEGPADEVGVIRSYHIDKSDL